MPAVVLLHGSGGVSGYVDDWARSLNCLGVATLTVDSFTGRGIDTTFMNQDALGRLSMIIDAYRAHELLARHPRIDASRIALMGFSRVILPARNLPADPGLGLEKVELVGVETLNEALDRLFD